MRLNRVLQLNRVPLLVAAISLMMFALVFTISCSGDDGKNGKDGESCIVVPDPTEEGTWNIECGGSFVAPLHSGDGEQGDKGQPGNPGKNGRDCQLGPKVGDAFQFICGGEPVGTLLRDCKVNEISSAEVRISCGNSSTVTLCNGLVIDPSKTTCTAGGTVAAEEGTCGKYGKTKINLATHYCGWAPTDDVEFLKESGEYPNGTTKYKVCPTSDESQPNADDWNDEYCRYTSETTAVVAGESPLDYCDGQPLNKLDQINDKALGGWAGEYCGFASNEAIKRTVLTGICDQPNEDMDDDEELGTILGPNQIAFGQGYCTVTYTDRKTAKTTYSEDFCGTSANNKPNENAWKSEYCGLADADALVATKIYSDICDDSIDEDGKIDLAKTPNGEVFNGGYCQVTFENRATNITEFTEEFCGTDGKPNDRAWKREYCGWTETSLEKDFVYSGAEGTCDDGEGPQAEGWNPLSYCQATDFKNETSVSTDVCPGSNDRYNEGGWKGEYCGYSQGAGVQTVQQGVCGDGQGPNSEAFGKGYCKVETKASTSTVYSDELCVPEGSNITTVTATNTVNKDTWQGQYCGFAKVNDDENGNYSVLKGACDDGRGAFENEAPEYYEEEYNERTDKTTLVKKKSQANNFYCQIPSPVATTTILADQLDDNSQFCGTAKKHLNENQWKNEWCFPADNVVSACTGGLVPVEGAKGGSSSNKCALPSVIAACANDLSGNYRLESYDGTNLRCTVSKSKVTVTTGCVNVIDGTKVLNPVAYEICTSLPVAKISDCCPGINSATNCAAYEAPSTGTLSTTNMGTCDLSSGFGVSSVGGCCPGKTKAEDCPEYSAPIDGKPVNASNPGTCTADRITLAKNCSGAKIEGQTAGAGTFHACRVTPVPAPEGTL